MANRVLVEQALKEGSIRGSQISECDLNGLEVSGVKWEHTDMLDLHANDIKIRNTQLQGSRFYRCSFMRASFEGSFLDRMVFDGLTLIKSRWHGTRVADSTLKNLCLQRAELSTSRFISSSLLDFEALDIKIENCIFAHCMFGISYGSGLNGFCNGKIKNSIFYNCRFEGYPFRGANIESSVFLWCSGQIGDEMGCRNVAGIGLRGNAQHKPLENVKAARSLLERYAS